MGLSFGKSYSLKSKKIIDRLFKEGTRISAYPFTAFVLKTSFDDQSSMKFVFSAPKKKFKRAVDRNRIKRICRESIRLHKDPLEAFLLPREQQLAVFLVYSAEEEIPHAALQKRTMLLIQKIIQRLDEASQ